MVINNFLKVGLTALNVSQVPSKDEIYQVYGEPIEVVGDNNYGYYLYPKGLQFGYFGTRIDEVALIFKFCQDEFYSVLNILLKETLVINKNTKIHELIKFMNYEKIKWESIDNHSIGAFSLRTEGNVIVMFDLETGELIKMCCLPPSLVLASR